MPLPQVGIMPADQNTCAENRIIRVKYVALHAAFNASNALDASAMTIYVASSEPMQLPFASLRIVSEL